MSNQGPFPLYDEEDWCDHYSWECNMGGHKCADCGLYGSEVDRDIECDACESQKTVEVQGSKPGFVTKDSGKRQDYESGMRRDVQEGKARFDLLLVEDQPYEEQFLTRIAQLLERGATKYGERNWQLANSEEELNRFRASGMRHMVQWATGELDEDHAAAVVFNLMAYEYTKWKLANG